MQAGVHNPLRALFTLTLFLSSGLLFLVQPMVAKIILPRFGGSSAVWTASMLFFQTLLLLGYLYAHASTKWLGVKRQAILHVVILALAAVFARVALPTNSGIASNIAIVLAVLGTMVGLPFFALSAGAPLIQKWFGETPDPAAKDPYFLYSASNLGSMAALVAYPFLIEPTIPLSRQGPIWIIGLYAVVGLMAVCGLMLQRQTPLKTLAVAEETVPIQNRQRLQWLFLAAVPSSLLLGVTNYLTTNVTPMPLLWVVPLALYLLTFIVAFARRQLVKSSTYARILPLIVTPLVLVMILEASEPIFLLGTIHLVAFTVAALMCHTRLVESRPAPGNLTEFYVWLSVGGAVGGMFNALVAPTVFSTLAEYPIALVAACLLRPRNPNRPFKLWHDVIFAGGMLALSIGIVLAARQAGMPPSQARTGLVIGLPAVVCFLMVDHTVRYALMIGALFLSANLMQINSAGKVAFTGRSFFGVHRVLHLANGRFHELVHGNTIHGLQDMQNPEEPKTYYTRNGPIGEVFSGLPNLKRVGLVGLGVGSCAAYGKPGQKLTYFEIDPVVEKIAKDADQFTFLRDSKAEVDVVLGDARLTLEQVPDGTFGLIVLDAFSSDSIPVHLITREAVQTYLAKLDKGGVLAFHISNRYLDLEPILAKVAESLGMSAHIQDDQPSEEEMRLGKRMSRWMVLARSPEDAAPVTKKFFWAPSQSNAGTPLWTDDYSNILSAYDPR